VFTYHNISLYFSIHGSTVADRRMKIAHVRYLLLQNGTARLHINSIQMQIAAMLLGLHNNAPTDSAHVKIVLMHTFVEMQQPKFVLYIYLMMQIKIPMLLGRHFQAIT